MAIECIKAFEKPDSIEVFWHKKFEKIIYRTHEGLTICRAYDKIVYGTDVSKLTCLLLAAVVVKTTQL